MATSPIVDSNNPDTSSDQIEQGKNQNTDSLYVQFGIQQINLKTQYTFDTVTAKLLGEDLCQYHRIVPVDSDSSQKVALAMAEPFDMIAQQIVRSKTKSELKIFQCNSDDIEPALGRIFQKNSNFEDTLQNLIEVDDESEEEKFADVSIDILRTEASDGPAIVFVNSLLVQAVQERASDIHIEPQETEIRIRLRVDGMLKELQAASNRLQSGVIARIKILGSMDIAERRIPQDGRIKFKIMGRSVDVRVSTIPSIYGEKIVLRILDKGSTSLNMDDLGIDLDKLEHFKEISKSASGMILVTGPTGSGKTTTLYSVLNFINSPHLNILTAEDPVEYRLNGITQIQIKPKVGLTFASALRAFLRQDPDIIMVGEMRDLETAEIGIKAALTGHLVLSTLHTNNAISTIMRLINLGIDKYLITSSLSLIISQRLLRRICLNCKIQEEPSTSLLKAINRFGITIPDQKYFIGKGCKHCSGSGFWGRAGIHELLFMSDTLKDRIISDASESELLQIAKNAGMASLIEDGLQKASRGITSLEEIIRVI